jgi:dsDNA-binding SOS-regulon protein
VLTVMSDDLIERLRREWSNADEDASFLAEAADRIAELEAALRETEDRIAAIASKEGDRYDEWFDLKEELERKRRHGTHQIRKAAANRIEELEAVLREIRDAPVGGLRTATVREIARRALDGER